MTAAVPVLVFARAPVPGRCKTRLIPARGAAGAARLHRQLVRRMLRAACASGLPVELWCAPDSGHGFFASCRRDFGVSLRRQASGDLGRRMARALRGRTALLTGTDCPGLDPHHLQAAAAALGRGYQAVLQPSMDGGYVLVGGRNVPGQALAGVNWSSGRERSQTLVRLKRLGLRVWQGSALPDLDTPADLRRARRAGSISKKRLSN